MNATPISGNNTNKVPTVITPEDPGSLPLSVAVDSSKHIVAAGFGGFPSVVPAGSAGASSTEQYAVRTWDLAESTDATGSQKPGAVLEGHTNSVVSLVFSKDGRYLASGGDDSTIIVWDMNNLGKAAIAPITLRTVGSTQAVAFSPDGRWLAGGGGEDRAVRLWDTKHFDASPKLLRGDDYTGEALAFSPDSTKLAAGEQNGVRVWDLGNADNPYALLRNDTGPIWSLAFGPDGKSIAAGGVDKNVVIWNLDNPQSPVQQKVLQGHKGTVKGLAFAPDGASLFSAGGDGDLLVWDLRHPGVEAATMWHQQKPIQSLSLGSDGDTLAIVGGDSAIRLFAIR